MMVHPSPCACVTCERRNYADMYKQGQDEGARAERRRIRRALGSVIGDLRRMAIEADGVGQLDFADRVRRLIAATVTATRAPKPKRQRGTP